MNENLNIQGPAVAVQKLIDVYQSSQKQPSSWTVISDQVMGGVSTAALHQDQRDQTICSSLFGQTRLANSGGFVQMRFDIEPSGLRSDYRGIFIERYGSA